MGWKNGWQLVYFSVALGLKKHKISNQVLFPPSPFFYYFVVLIRQIFRMVKCTVYFIMTLIW